MSDGTVSDQGTAGRRVTVSTSTCEGTGYCVLVCPSVFSVGADGKSVVNEAAARLAPLADLTEAETMCPTSAVRVHQPAD